MITPVNALRYVQQKLSSIKYIAPCFLLESEQMVHIFSVLVFFCICAPQIHYFTRFLIKLSIIKLFLEAGSG